MEEAKLASLLSNVRKSNDKGAIYRNLVAIRANFVTSDGGIKLFTAQDGINVLVELLSKPYEKVIEVVLSILGNCCTKKECCKQVGFRVKMEILFHVFDCALHGGGKRWCASREGACEKVDAFILTDPLLPCVRRSNAEY